MCFDSIQTYNFIGIGGIGAWCRSQKKTIYLQNVSNLWFFITQMGNLSLKVITCVLQVRNVLEINGFLSATASSSNNSSTSVLRCSNESLLYHIASSFGQAVGVLLQAWAMTNVISHLWAPKYRTNKQKKIAAQVSVPHSWESSLDWDRLEGQKQNGPYMYCELHKRVCCLVCSSAERAAEQHTGKLSLSVQCQSGIQSTIRDWQIWTTYK